MQCCTCSKWICLRGSLLFFSRFKTLGSSHSWSCFSCCASASSGGPTPTNTVSSRWTPPFCIPPLCYLAHLAPLLIQHCGTTLAFKPITLLLHTLHLLPLHSFHRLIFLAVFLNFLLPLSPPPRTPTRFFNGMLEVSAPGAQNYYTLSRLILLTLHVSRNPILTRHSSSGSLSPLFFYLSYPLFAFLGLEVYCLIKIL